MESLSYSNHHMMNFQFLSVCHYITSFGKIFYNLDLITQENQNYSVPVLNALFDYIHKSKNESETKLQLIREVLKGRGIYSGGKENETLDGKYVEATYQYIISSALFSHYGNIHGYLASIIREADNITYSALKENVFYQLSQNYITYDYCSSSHVNYQLTTLTVEKVFNDHVWSMFPEPEQNMEIMDIKYIYAMIGLKIIRSIQGDTTNLFFENYILLAQFIELQTLNDDTIQLAMELYATPALFYYAFKEKKHCCEEVKSNLNGNFFRQTLTRFLLFLNFQQNMMFTQEFNKNMFNRFNKLLNKFNIMNFKEFLDNYSEKVLNVLQKLEVNSLEQLLLDGKMINKFNSNVTGNLISVFHQSEDCRVCIRGTNGKYGGIFIVFEITENEKNDFYALQQDSNTISLFSNINKNIYFEAAANNDIYDGIKYPIFFKNVKYLDENYTVFVKKVAKVLSYIQGKNLFYPDDDRSKEERLEEVKSFAPFYTCIESIKSDNNTEVVRICRPVVKNLLPIPEIDDIMSTVWKSLIIETGQQTLRTSFKSEINHSKIRYSLHEVYKKIRNNFFSYINVEQINTNSIQTLKPGFELSFETFDSFSTMLPGILQALNSRFSSHPNVKNLLLAMKSAIDLLDKYTALIPNVSNMTENEVIEKQRINSNETISEPAKQNISEEYNKWNVTNHMFIDDVLSQKVFHQFNNLESAESAISYIFTGAYKQIVEPVFKNYHNTPKIRELIRFEDYYVIYSYLYNNLLWDSDAPRRVAGAVRRLALRQCQQEQLETLITIYSAADLDDDKSDGSVIYIRKCLLNFVHLQKFYSDRESALSKCKTTNVVLYELQVTNSCGIVNLTSILPDPNVHYYVPEETVLKIINRSEQEINKTNVSVVKIHNEKLPKDNRIDRLVIALKDIISSDTKFYANYTKISKFPYIRNCLVS